MNFHVTGIFWRISISSALAAALLAACAGDRDPPAGDPSFYRNLAVSGAQLDAGMAASMISGYRRNNGLSAVALDPMLMKLAEAQARGMASRDRLDHNVERGFTDRIRASGYDAKVAVENIGAGYHTLAQAFSGWRDSPSHRANMLSRDATQMGIAAVYSPRSKYKVFWALIMAAPDDRRGRRS
ncbi:MAG: CAP domain-containing protein [Xanthobacteraceae bacterium]